MEYSSQSRNKQKGMTLMVAMITLVVLMLLGVGAMVASNTMFKLAGNVQFENEAKNRAESALDKDWLMTGTNNQNAGFTTSAAPYYDPTAVITPLTNWPSSASAPATGEQFIIQRITTDTIKICPLGYVISGTSCVSGAATVPTMQYHLYRVTARGTSKRGATRFVESIVRYLQ
jgi:Tfp pilus assembly protein PilX